MALIDTHCHLDFPKFDPDRSTVIERAARVGVERILIPALTLTSALNVVKLAESHPRLLAAIGVHPTEAKTWDQSTKEELRHLLTSHTLSTEEGSKTYRNIVAIGEIGLDYYWDAAPAEVQKSVLWEQLELAAEYGLPVILHFREKGDAPDGPCAADLLSILEKWVNGLRTDRNPLAKHPGVLHSFSGSSKSAQQAIQLGFYIGVSGPVTYRKDRQEVIATLPLEHLLLETDAPFLAPTPHRGKRNEPANLSLIADKIAILHQTTLETVATVTTANARQLFQWDR
ncbi:MAG: TatD family hydrolase [Anaerolineales bacterium]|nr:TatD family hydrolase [Anaerolineales bacterium]MCX7608815.1 TatD family hydrolase [Anaerolineales bacterium]MDW8228073.1 TatD family hydrolase [Anaerolineales bacterium]